jgi:hypothetical protein
MTSMINLLPFCHTGLEHHKFNGINYPKIIGEHAYATDTKIGFRIPAANTTRFPDEFVNMRYWDYFPLKEPKSLPELPTGDLYKMFTDHDGDVYLNKIDSEETFWFKLDKCEYQIEYLRKIARLPGVKVQETQFADTWVLLFECSGGGQGVLVGKVDEKPKGGAL